MIDFVENPYLGELLNTLHEEGVLISLICHVPVAMVSAKYRVSVERRCPRRFSSPAPRRASGAPPRSNC